MEDSDKMISIAPVAYFRSPFPSRFGVPRQSGVVADIPGEIVFVPEFRREEALKGIEEFSHLWLIWGFSGNAGRWQMTVRPPRLGGNKSVGVFASRSPFRPNGLGLSSVVLDKVDRDAPDGPVLKVLGADLMDGTPIYDIKPYVSYADSHPDARCGYVDSLKERELALQIGPEVREALASFPEAEALLEVLSLDPRPSYQDDPERVYGLSFSGKNARFTVKDGLLTLLSLEDC